MDRLLPLYGSDPEAWTEEEREAYDAEFEASLAEPLTAAWNPLLHPRGRDGRFIEIGSIIRWFMGADQHDGTVTGISSETGDLRVRDHDGSVQIVQPRDVIEVDTPKAHLDPIDAIVDALRPALVDDEKSAQEIKRRTKRVLGTTPEGRLLDEELSRWLPGDTEDLRTAVVDHTTETSQVVLETLAHATDAPELHRGEWHEDATPDDLLPLYAPGSTFDSDLSSFSANTETAEMFGSHGRPGTGTPLIITVEAGGHGIPIQNLAGGWSKRNPEGSFWRKQEEYLAGGQYEVVSTRKYRLQNPTNPNPYWQYDAVEVRVREVNTLPLVDTPTILPTVIEPGPTTIDTNIDRNVEFTDYTYGDMTWTSPTADVQDGWERAYSTWSGYDGNYDMRQVSAALMGEIAPPSYGDELGPPEVHRMVETGVSEGQPDWAVERAHEAVEDAYVGMKAVLYGEKAKYDSYRGISNVANDAAVLKLRDGDEFTMPLSAFTPKRDMAVDFARPNGELGSPDEASIIFKLRKGAKVAPAPEGYEDEVQVDGEWVQVPAEYVTQGQFRVVKHRVTQKIVPVTDINGDQVQPVRYRNQHEIELEQIGVFDPDTRRLESTVRKPRFGEAVLTPAIPPWVMTEMGHSGDAASRPEPELKTGVYDGTSEMNEREALDALKVLFPRTNWEDRPLPVTRPDGTTGIIGGRGEVARIYGLDRLTPRERAAYVQAAQYMVEHYPGVADVTSLNIENAPLLFPDKKDPTKMSVALGSTSIRGVGPNYDFKHGPDVSMSASMIHDAIGADGKVHNPDSPTTAKGITDPAEYVAATMIHEFAHVAHFHAIADWYSKYDEEQGGSMGLDGAYETLNQPDSVFGKLLHDGFHLYGEKGPTPGLRDLWLRQKTAPYGAGDNEPTVYAMTNPAEFFAEMLTAEVMGLPVPDQEAFDALLTENVAAAVTAAGLPDFELEDGETEAAIWVEGQGWTIVDTLGFDQDTAGIVEQIARASGARWESYKSKE